MTINETWCARKAHEGEFIVALTSCYQLWEAQRVADGRGVTVSGAKREQNHEPSDHADYHEDAGKFESGWLAPQPELISTPTVVTIYVSYHQPRVRSAGWIGSDR